MTHDWTRAIAPGPADTVLLQHHDLPGTRVYVRPCWRRRVGLVRSKRATRSEMRAWWAAWETA